MKTVQQIESGNCARMSDELAKLLININPEKHRYVPKWYWKVQEGMEYRGERHEN